MRSALILLVVVAGCKKEVKDSAPDNTAPEVSVTSPALGSTWALPETVRLEAEVSDAEDAPEDLTVTVLSSLQGVVADLRPSAEGAVVADLSLGAGTHRLTVTVADSEGRTASAENTIRVVAGSAPTQPAVALDPAEPVTGTDLAALLLVESVDPEGDPLSYIWSWTVDGADAGIGTPEVDGAQVSAGQVWEVSVYASDQTSTSPAARASAVIADGVADPGGVSVSPAAAIPGDLLTCVYSDDPPSDPEGGAVAVSYTWEQNGAALAETGAVLDTAGMARGDEVRCAVVTDDGVNVTSWPSAPIRLGNNLPVATVAWITPVTATESSLLTCRASGSDPDGDPVSFSWRWLVDSGAGFAEAGRLDTLDGAAFGKGDGVRCEVTPSDSYGAGAPVQSAGIVVGNTAPEAPVVAFTRADPVPGVVAGCEVVAEAVDVDGDALSYRWSWAVNGVADSETGSSRGTTGLLPGDVLTCMAMADDGASVGPAGSADLAMGAPTRGDVMAADAWSVITGPIAGAAFGKAVDVAGDLDGDGVLDLLVSATDVDGTGAGAVYLFAGATLAAGGSFNTADAMASWIGDDSGDALGGGRGAVGAGDVDGDGVADLLFGAPTDEIGGAGSGAVYLVYGGGSLGFSRPIGIAADARFRGEAGDGLGTRLAAADWDGDGFSDLAMSAPTSDEGATDGGRVLVFSGAGGVAGTYDVAAADGSITGTQPGTQLGWSLAAVGDPNDDGYPDLGSSLIYDDTNGADAGTAVVFSGDRLSGGRNWIQASFLVVHGMSAGDRFGYDIAGPGDISGDGVDDLLLGGYQSDAGGTESGEVRVYPGVAGLNREVDADRALLLFEGAAGSQSGSSLSGIGDFDGDGRLDWVAGAPRLGETGAEAGGCEIRLGQGWPWAGGPEIRILGDAAGDWLCDEVSGALELDGDGYADFAVGAQQATTAGGATGAVYLFKGP